MFSNGLIYFLKRRDSPHPPLFFIDIKMEESAPLKQPVSQPVYTFKLSWQRDKDLSSWSSGPVPSLCQVCAAEVGIGFFV